MDLLDGLHSQRLVHAKYIYKEPEEDLHLSPDDHLPSLIFIKLCLWHMVLFLLRQLIMKCKLMFDILLQQINQDRTVLQGNFDLELSHIC